MSRQDSAAELRDFEEFVALRSASWMRTAFLLVGSREAAEDLVQNALERTFVRWRRVRRMDLPEAYVRRIVINGTHEAWRAARRLPMAVGTAPDDEATGRVADHADGVALRASLLSALDRLPHGMRTVVVLRYWEELSVQEVADLLRCSTGNVKSQASRGLEQLRQLIDVESGSFRG